MDKSIDARLEQLVKRVDILQATVDRFIEQLNDDRKDLSDMKVNIAKLEASVSGAREDIHDQTKVMVKEVKENLQPIPDVVSDAVSEAVKKKKGLFK
jgi:peptidoglycan hydrolase CwlO-like protein